MGKKKHISPHKKQTRGHVKHQGDGTRGEKLSLNDSLDIIFGYHAVHEALKNKARKHKKLYATPNALTKLHTALPALPLEAISVRAEDISKTIGKEAVHQGLLLQSVPLEYAHIEDIPTSDAPLVVVLDQVTDPHNIGAIMRSAVAFGARFMITTDRHSPKDTMTLIKAASGAREHMTLARVTNLARTITDLQDKGFFVIGLDSEADIDLNSPQIKTLTQNTPTALVLGAEGKGLRRLTREKCDMMARLNASGPIVSLNVSNAAALALYELSRPA